MCGRFSVKDSMNKVVSDLFNVHFEAKTNTDLCPSQTVSAIIKKEQFNQVNVSWGIKPSWSKKLLINAQSETVNNKPTFKNAFRNHRCLIPCNGWYEWRMEEGKKVKYYFEHADKEPLYMAGILFPSEQKELVTLTTSLNPKCSEYHKRMPAIVLPENVDYWFGSNTKHLQPVMLPVHEDLISITKM